MALASGNETKLELPEAGDNVLGLTPRSRAKARWCKVKYSLSAIAASEARTPTGAEQGRLFSFDGIKFDGLAKKPNVVPVRRPSLSSAASSKTGGKSEHLEGHGKPGPQDSLAKPLAAKSLHAALCSPPAKVR